MESERKIRLSKKIEVTKPSIEGDILKRDLVIKIKKYIPPNQRI